MRTTGLTLTSRGTFLAVLLTFSGHLAGQTPPPALTTLYTFRGGPADGAAPGTLVFGKGGVLYGTTGVGGAFNAGTVFSLTPPATSGGAWTETILYNFATGSGDATSPNSSLVMDSNGVLYGTTSVGGAKGLGTVFSLAPPSESGSAWTETVLYSFTGAPGDGAEPLAGVVFGSGGVLYGTTNAGGPGACEFVPIGCGTVFQLAPPSYPGGAWTESVLHSFNATGGGRGPNAPLAVGSRGELYGTTYVSGASGGGVVFALTPPSEPGGSWTKAVLSNQLGSELTAGVVIGKKGVLYGTTQNGGFGNGTVFSLTPPASPGGAWTQKVLYTFRSTPDGGTPIGGVAIGNGGVLYGATSGGGANSEGAIFSLKPPSVPGGAWTEGFLYSLTYSEGISPRAGVVIGRNRLIYGTAATGGLGYGTVFSLKP
ncbi:MAG TPA: choice-of-anchor tandem repeat GloVer-containing protein [Bryobacteraceae bacterium]|nr:choice-of-anchor tandem repeat GloVer-containing protein [Bryobacteraceae bacterium]